MNRIIEIEPTDETLIRVELALERKRLEEQGPTYWTKQQWLDYFSNKYDAPFHTRYKVGKRGDWNKWLLYPSKDYTDFHKDYTTPNHRIVFSDEVVIESDLENKKANRMYMDAVMERMNIYDVEGAMYTSGNKSCHIHLWFSELNDLDVDDRKEMKWLLVKFFCKRKVDGRLKGFTQKAKVDKELVYSKRHMIRLENGIHEKTSKTKNYIKGVLPYVDNRIPPEVWLLWRKRKEEIKNRVIYPYITDGNIPPCVSFLEQQDFINKGDCRKRALFIITTHYKKTMNPVQLLDKLKHWNDYVLRRYFNDFDLKRMVIQHTSPENINKGMSCKYRSEILRELGKLEVCPTCASYQGGTKNEKKQNGKKRDGQRNNRKRI